MKDRYHAIVCGLGAAGSATLYHLAKYGLKVLGLEAQNHIAHSLGSSHGESRIIRLVYQEDPRYVPLLKRAYQLWRHLEQETSSSLLETTGCLNISAPQNNYGTDASSGPHSCYSGALESAKTYGLPCETLNTNQITSRFPAFNLPDGFQALFDPAGGYLHPERCIKAFISAAKKYKAVVHCGSPVIDWDASTHPDKITVTTGNGNVYIADRFILTPGPWMSTLVPELRTVLTIERQVVGWFDCDFQAQGACSESNPYRAPNLPVFLLDDGSSYYYGFPADDKGQLKIGKYNHLREVYSSPDDLHRDSLGNTGKNKTRCEDEQALRACLQRYIPALSDADMAKASVCMFTNTPDGHFILDSHPRHRGGRVILGSACSGHGFKFAPVIGEILSDLAIKGSTRFDISMHALHRKTLIL